MSTPIEVAMEQLRQARIALFVLSNEKTQALLKQRLPPVSLATLYIQIKAARAVVKLRKLAVIAVGGP